MTSAAPLEEATHLKHNTTAGGYNKHVHIIKR